ncbi:MAG: DapH/DapD/GlmU-related protein [Planctomycetota bacterium]
MDTPNHVAGNGAPGKLSASAAAQLALADAGRDPGLKTSDAPTASQDQPTELSSDHYVRAKLFAGEKSNLRRYIDLVLGEDAGVWSLIKFELMTTLLGGVRGALGLQLRQWFYPRLFKSCGRGVVFGRNLTIRHGKSITIGDHVIIDDQCELDAHGAGDAGVVIGDRSIVNRDVSIKAKIGSVHIGRECDIGMRSDLHSQGGLLIGDRVVLGGGTKISGGIFQIDRAPARGISPAPDSDPEARPADDREQERSTSGPIRIEDKCIVGMRSTFLDGVAVGEGCVIGACSLVNKDLPAYCVAAGVPARVLRERLHHEDVTVS